MRTERWKIRVVVPVLAVILGSCTRPEAPRAGFRWPAGWPDPAGPECAAPEGLEKPLRKLSEALRAGRLGEADRRYRELLGKPLQSDSIRLAGAEVAFFNLDPAGALNRLGPAAEGECWPISFVRAESLAARSSWDKAWAAMRTVPAIAGREFVSRERDRIEESAVDALVRDAQALRAAKRVDDAKRVAAKIALEHPKFPDGYIETAHAGAMAGDIEGALTVLKRGRALFPSDQLILDTTLEIASGAGRWDAALAAAEDLARIDPSRKRALEEVRRKWSLSNAPDAVRRALDSQRLTRLDLAVLLWWQVPEIRNIAAGEAPIATDVLDRPEKTYLVRALALGLWSVDAVTHAAHPDLAVSRRDLGAILTRLTERLAPGKESKADGWIAASAEGSANPDKLDGKTAADALLHFRHGVFGGSQ